jgi:hypothetical protein
MTMTWCSRDFEEMTWCSRDSLIIYCRVNSVSEDENRPNRVIFFLVVSFGFFSFSLKNFGVTINEGRSLAAVLSRGLFYAGPIQ